MAGLSCRPFKDSMFDALRRKAFKPDTRFAADPVPARSASSCTTHIEGFRGAVNFARDPVPAGVPDECNDVMPFRPASGFSADPIPARMI